MIDWRLKYWFYNDPPTDSVSWFSLGFGSDLGGITNHILAMELDRFHHAIISNNVDDKIDFFFAEDLLAFAKIVSTFE